MVIEPKPYSMTRPEEIERWFQEMEGYFKRGGEGHFLKQGTDIEGREHVYNGFFALKELLLYHTADIKLVCFGCNMQVLIINLKEIERNVFLCPFCYDKCEGNL